MGNILNPFNGGEGIEDIEDYIEAWHNSDSDEEIYEYLGMTMEEYFIFVEDDSMLKTIFYAREVNITITDFLRNNTEQMLAARSATPEEAATVKEWLARTGRLKQGD
ncbi:hypothetical protein KHA94_23930 [Bacillus sp. FJAT-49705]|uniref:Uncharacterized protein n=1 Tax=Cytobacillus citreus TaxID=2833586 RepID=A0ABS5NZ93_9BACI|nr:hypothetical protein [Cytobacillus citreus]MBS4193155.1 hypothetical protein [Cytobacillus citreus]